MAKPNKYDAQHLRNLGLTDKQVAAVYEAAMKEAAAIGVSITNFNPDKPFSFSDYPQTKARIDKVIKELQKGVETAIVNGVRSEWTLSNNKNDELCRQVFGDNIGKLSDRQYKQYFNNNDKAREAFLKRKVNGLNLSDRVWKYTDQFKEEIELGLDLGIRDGLSAEKMARDLKQYLKYKDKLFRRVRDEHGQLRLSKAAKAFNPGQGVYRSSHKNARRLAATETNMAYRTSDHERWQQMDFVVGIEIKLSNNHTLNGKPFTDICDELAGKYPKNFVFVGWHPLCRCYVISILKTPEEMKADSERIMNGEAPTTQSVNTVKDMPENFQKWVIDNEDRIAKANDRGTLPYFLKDNRQLWKDYTSIKLINQQAIKQTASYASLLNAKSEDIANRLDVLVTPVNIKSEHRIIEKAIAEYYGDIFQVNDIIRNTFIASDSKIQSVIDNVEKQFKIIDHKRQSTPMGYSGNLLKILVRDGVKGEIQVNSPQMIYAKEPKAKDILGSNLFNKIKEKSGLPHGLGHGYYEDYRILSPAEKQSEKGIKLVEESKRYYEKIGSVKLQL
jgi:hypothetical protein